MKNKFLLLLVFSASLIYLFSCTKPDIQFGAQLLNIENTQIVKVDTFTPKLSTVYVDSFVTSGLGIGLVGGYIDPFLGSVSAQTFLEIQPPEYTSTPNNALNPPYKNTIFDSIMLILKVKKGNYYGDTTQPLNINVYQLTQLITPVNNGTTLYNVDTTAANPTPLGSASFTYYPARTDTLAIRLNDAVGIALFNKLKNTNDPQIQTAAAFLNYMAGLKLSSPAFSKLAIGFSDSVILRIHYTQTGMFLNEQKVDFKFSNAPHQYNNITINRTGSLIAGINSVNREIPSELTNNMSFVQSNTGTIAKISFPSLVNALQLPSFARIMRAILIIRPMPGSYLNYYPLPPQLRLSQTSSAANTLGNDITVVTASGATSVEYGNLSIDYLQGVNTSYTYDLTSYFKSFLFNNVNFAPGNHYGLLLSPPNNAFSQNFNRTIIGNNANTVINGKLELQIYYTAVQ